MILWIQTHLVLKSQSGIFPAKNSLHPKHGDEGMLHLKSVFVTNDFKLCLITVHFQIQTSTPL